jgi:hypothetical protein
MENRIWIIRFADGTSGSYRGTKDGAAKIAELKKDLYGGNFVVKGR